MSAVSEERNKNVVLFTERSDIFCFCFILIPGLLKSIYEVVKASTVALDLRELVSLIYSATSLICVHLNHQQ